jgi:hypothetical protein
MWIRWVIVISIYAAVVVFLPRVRQVEELFSVLLEIHPNTAVMISGVALLVAALGEFLLWRQPNGLLRTHPSRWLYVVHMGLLGVLISGVFDIFERLSGVATNVTGLILIPIAFMVAEAIYLALDWRFGPFQK